MKLMLILALTFWVHCSAFAQKVVLNNQVDLDKIIQNELVSLTINKSFKHKVNRDFAGILGYVIVDIMINRKGKVTSIFTKETNLTNIDFLEFLNDKILEHNFNLVLAKGENIKTTQKLIIQ